MAGKEQWNIYQHPKKARAFRKIQGDMVQQLSGALQAMVLEVGAGKGYRPTKGPAKGQGSKGASKGATGKDHKGKGKGQQDYNSKGPKGVGRSNNPKKGK